ncbi:CotH kinase family protein [Dysosmobacter sp. Marseille-Q4140]|nr:CotH kinase family protein [Dysosmobacter sp. Marseille-Q4140]
MPRPFMDPPKNDYDTFLSSNFFVVRFDRSGAVLSVDVSRTSAVTEAEAEEMACRIYESGDESGRTGRFRYLLGESRSGRGSALVFLDTSVENLSYLRVLLLSGAAGLACWGVMLLLVIFLSRRAIRPIVENMEKQKQLNEGTDIEAVVDVDQVIRYFVVHNFVCNFDSYTGSMIHNYYLYEEDGLLSMIPWDYNLAFGGFQGGGDATSMVNYPIDTPVSGGTVESRPMLAWIFADEEYTALYHQYFSEFIAQYFESGYFEQMMAETKALIAPYVEQDPTKFCTYEEFEAGIDTLERFCLLRAQSVRGQLEGTIPSTDEGQTEDGSALVDASGLSISDMGSMNNGGMGGGIGIRDRGQTGEGDLSASTGAPAEQEGSQPDAGEPSAGSPQGADDAADEASAMPEQQTAPNDVPSPDAAGGGQPSAASSAGDSQQGHPTDRNSAMTFPGNSAVSGTTSTDTLLLLGASAAVLLIGLLAAVLYRKRA